MLVPEEEIERRRREEGLPDYPESQTPWQEIYRSSVSGLDGGGVMEAAEVSAHRVEDTPPQPLTAFSKNEKLTARSACFLPNLVHLHDACSVCSPLR